VGLTILPLINADTRQRIVDGYPRYLRKNPNGVDLNRNFNGNWSTAQVKYGRSTNDPDSPTYRGESAESEKETQAVVDFIAKTRPLVVISLHVPGAYMLTPRAVTPELTARCLEVGNTFIGTNNSDPATRIPGGGVRPESMPGTLSAWITEVHDVPAFDQESDRTPECIALNEHRLTRDDINTLRARNYNSLRALLRYFAENPSIR
jgi:hypothetical protein